MLFGWPAVSLIGLRAWRRFYAFEKKSCAAYGLPVFNRCIEGLKLRWQASVPVNIAAASQNSQF